MLNLEVINCGNYIYITSKENRSYYDGLSNYIFDGNKPEPTSKSNWYKLNKQPDRITKKKPAEKTNIRYELKAGYTPSDLMPSVITLEEYNTEEFDEVIKLYDYKYDEVEVGYEDIEFKISTIHKKENFEFVPKKYNTEVSLITQLEYPEELWQEQPCKISSQEMYTIIRNHVKSNIDGKVAQVTSDYDFHFEVSKQIGLANPYSKMIDTNNSWMNKRRKPKWVSKMISDKKEVILNLKRKPSDSDYGGSSLAPEITGKNQLDLQTNVDRYLGELMTTINKKYCECPQCQGWGIVEVK